jgi:hypothetical protein
MIRVRWASVVRGRVVGSARAFGSPPSPRLYDDHVASSNDSDAARKVLTDARVTLRKAELGLHDVGDAHADRRRAGMANVIVWGRAVTNVLQQLRSKAPGFEDWYRVCQEEMRADPLLRFFYVWRSQSLKEGVDPPTSTSTLLRHFSSDDIPSPPKNARAFMLDGHGRPFWEVERGDGSIERVPADVPNLNVENFLDLDDVPPEHMGEPILDRSAMNVCRLYLEYLGALVAEAEALFGPDGDPTAEPRIRKRPRPRPERPSYASALEELAALALQCHQVTHLLHALVFRPRSHVPANPPTGDPDLDRRNAERWMEATHTQAMADEEATAREFYGEIAIPLWDFYDHARKLGFSNEKLGRQYRRAGIHGGTRLAMTRWLEEELCPQIEEAAHKAGSPTPPSP